MDTHSMPTRKSTGSQLVRLYIVIFCLWSSLYLFVPIMTPFAELRGASLQMVGWLVGSYGLVQLILRIPLGMWSDRLRKRKPFIIYGFGAALIPDFAG